MGETFEEYVARITGDGATPNKPAIQPLNPQAWDAGAAPASQRNSSGGGGTQIILPDEGSKNLSVAQILDLLSLGEKGGGFSAEMAQAELLSVGYDERQAGLILKLGEKGAGAAPEISLGYMFQAMGKGVMSESQVAERLRASGYSAEDVAILINTNRKDVDPTESMSPESLEWKSFELGQLSSPEMYRRLNARGYNDQSIREQIATHKAMNQGKDGGGGGSGGGSSEQKLTEERYKKNELESNVNRANASASRAEGQAQVINAPSGGGGGGQRPQARQVLDDFRSSFVRNMKANGAGLSMPQKQWALDNMDTFLPQFLGTTEGAAFTLGATEIANAYEGSRNTQRSSRSGSGVIQTRGL